MKKQNEVIKNILVYTLLLSGILYFSLGAANKTKEREKDKNLKMFSQALLLLKSNYVDSLSYDDLIEAAIDGMAKSLDLHTNFMTPEAYDDLMTDTKGSFGGIGVQIGLRDGILTVISPIEGSPAHKLGIIAGDEIVDVEGKSTKGWTTKDAMKVLRGDKGSPVNIKIAREGIEKPLDFTIVRDIIKIESVPYYFMLTEDVGYVRLTQFSENSPEELEKALTNLENQGMKKLVFDLRSNPGGLLSSAVDILDLFVEKGKLLVESKGRINSSYMQYFSRRDTKRDYPIGVLIDGGSASASEIVAGGLQDYDKALIVGTNSFGKGSVQRPYPLLDDFAIKITIAKYYTPSGRNIHKERDQYGHVIEDSTKEMPIFKTSMGRTVYGGGGIVPDFEVKPALISEFIVKLISKSVFFDTAIRYNSKFHKLPNSFDYKNDKDLWEIFFEILAEKNIEYDDTDLLDNKEQIENRLKSELLGSYESYKAKSKVLIESDIQVKELIKVLEENDTMPDLLKSAESLNKIE